MNLTSGKRNYNFMGMGKFAIPFSVVCLALAAYIWISTGSAKYGIDYLGGHEIVVKIEGAAGSEQIRSALATSGLVNAVVQSFERGSGEFSIRLTGDQRIASPPDMEELAGLETEPREGAGQPAEALQSAQVVALIRQAMDRGFEGRFSIEGVDYIGPAIGEELRNKSIIAIILSLIGILAYITYRFEFAFALGAVVALFHDVIICIGIYLLAGRTLSLTALAAALTVVGYSVNDTIVVFDRMREEIFKRKEFELVSLMNDSINATLSRTVITSLTTAFSALALLLFGGGAIADLSVFLVAGVITGTYSTIFIASPVALAWEDFRSRRERREGQEEREGEK